LYRGIDEDGNLVDVTLSQKRDKKATKAFFAQAHELVEDLPQRLVTDCDLNQSLALCAKDYFKR